MANPRRIVLIAAILSSVGIATATPASTQPSGSEGGFDGEAAQRGLVIPTPPPAAPPSSPGLPDEMPEHATKVVDYTLRAKLDPALHTVHGEGTLVWLNVSNKPLSELWFHLYLNAFKNQASVFMREPVGGFRGTTIPRDWGAIDVRRLTWIDGGEKRELWPTAELRRPGDEDETDVRVPLPRAVAPGESIVLEMVWDDKMPTVVERTGYDGSFHMMGQWFPKIAKIEPDGTWAHFPFHHLGEFYADFGHYDVTLDVPKAFTIGATGPILDEHLEGDRRIERHVQDDVHDFAWTAWDKWQTRREVIAGVDVTMLYPPRYEKHAERELATMRFALPYYGEHYGTYPYRVLTLVHPPSTVPEAGGMEYPTLITTGAASYIPNGIYMSELVTIHEFGHQYFYGLVATHETKWPFQDEGLNSYAEADAMRRWKGAGSAVDFLGIVVGDGEGHAERAHHFVHDDRVAQRSYTFGTGNAYGALVYSRTATILETIARVFGRVAMDDAMRTYTRRFRFKHPEPNDLIAVFREKMGPRAADMLRAALFDKGWVDFSVTQLTSHASRPPAGMFDVAGKRETVAPGRTGSGKYEGWVLVTRRGTLSMPVEIALVAADGTRTKVEWDGVDESFRVPYSGSSQLRAVLVDPDSKILLDQDRTNDFATVADQPTAGAPRVMERSTYWSQLLTSLIGP